MRVLSCRCLSLSRFSSSGISILSPNSKLVFAALAACLLSGCVSPPQDRSIFKTPGIDQAQWRRIQTECRYEVEKATASARTDVTYTRDRIFRLCAELKGATYVGMVSITDEQWRNVRALCNAEAKAAVANRPASHSRDVLQEDLAIECIKRQGVVFSESL